MGLVLTVSILVALLFAVPASAAPPKAPSPHEAAAAETGRIVGTLTGDAGAPLSSHTVTIEVLRGHALILALPKQSDARGRYEFKNIFRSPEFSYAVSAEHDGRTFRTPFVSLSAKEEERVLDLAVGSGAAAGPALPPPASREDVADGAGDAPPPASHRGDGLGQYKLLAALLSLGAVAYALARRRT